jgi:hypothetical protein
MQLHELASLVRSKNAGPFMLTIDIMFEDPADYRRVRDSGVLSAATVADVYGVDPRDVQVFHYEPATALKISLPRPHPSGSQEDGDVYGGQFHAPLVLLEIPPVETQGATGT